MFFGEHLSLTQILGCITVTLGVLLLAATEKPSTASGHE
jgi:drug/metabolite transporter (DMT)-like permease